MTQAIRLTINAKRGAKTGVCVYDLTLPADLEESKRKEGIHFNAIGYPGLSVRVRDWKLNGKLSLSYYVGRNAIGVVCGYDGKPLGKVTTKTPMLSLDEARERALKVINDRKNNGIEFSSERRRKLVEATETFGSFLDKYLAGLAVKKSTFGRIDRDLRVVCKTLHNKPVRQIGRLDITDLQDELFANTPSAADQLIKTLRPYFTWLLSREKIASNPCDTIKKRAKNRARTRILTADELRTLWLESAGDGYRSGGAYGQNVRLLILTGCRKMEIGALRQDEIDEKFQWIELSEARSKNGSRHFVYLGKQAREILRSVEPRESGMLFSDGKTGYRSHPDHKHRISIQGWCIHDIRRTFTSVLIHVLMVAGPVVDALINHVNEAQLKQIAQTTRDHYMGKPIPSLIYVDECREAIAKWDDFITRLVAGQLTEKEQTRWQYLVATAAQRPKDEPVDEEATDDAEDEIELPLAA